MNDALKMSHCTIPDHDYHGRLCPFFLRYSKWKCFLCAWWLLKGGMEAKCHIKGMEIMCFGWYVNNIYLASLPRRGEIFFRFSPLIFEDHTCCCECHDDFLSLLECGKTFFRDKLLRFSSEI